MRRETAQSVLEYNRTSILGICDSEVRGTEVETGIVLSIEVHFHGTVEQIVRTAVFTLITLLSNSSLKQYTFFRREIC